MPQQDRTGPDGKGPMTGRGLGKCNPNKNTENNTEFIKGRGLRRRAFDQK